MRTCVCFPAAVEKGPCAEGGVVGKDTSCSDSERSKNPCLLWVSLWLGFGWVLKFLGLETVGLGRDQVEVRRPSLCLPEGGIPFLPCAPSSPLLTSAEPPGPRALPVRTLRGSDCLAWWLEKQAWESWWVMTPRSLEISAALNPASVFSWMQKLRIVRTGCFCIQGEEGTRDVMGCV